MGTPMNVMKLDALPKGFRFWPTDEELVSHYLRLKINGNHSAVEVIPEVDICRWEPWDLPALSVIKSSDREWFFFCPRDKKYSNGHRSNRATEAGYWKATGKDRMIKSRKSSSSGHSGSHLIGMKKTLVFHRGRAPKGERTNWIMHEYRATEPDLDGTGPGQGDYVLCRLFHKADEKVENLKYDDVEHTGLSPPTNKSSPDEVSSDLFREPATLDMKTLEEREDMSKWWTDQADSVTPINQVPLESCASDGVDHQTDMEVYLPLQEVSKFEEAAHNQFDEKISGALQPHGYTDLDACIGSPYAGDFGNEQSALHFEDGTSEQDTSLSELFQGLQNNGYYFCGDSTSHKTSVVTSDSFTPAPIDEAGQTPSAIFEGQISPIFMKEASSTEHLLSQYAVEGVDPSVNIVEESHDKPVETFHNTGYIRDDHSPINETGIKIRSRRTQDHPTLVNSTIQGTAPRRIRLWTATKDISRRTSKESEDRILNENVETARPCGLKLAVKHSDQNEKTSFMVSVALSACQGASYLRESAVSTCVVGVVILLVVFLGMLACPSLHALHS